ncbi:MAG: tRNA uridine-5-carboxymethylaminomethyl(34) synthesis GTPase MnmE [Rhizobiales bacterium]|nr:tRNA uridine-5-carboxymethylaminomethyl(34) synthesis GTPase MnmE [Hyphomicrobiales bacterium]
MSGTTIYALSSAQGRAGVAILRLSGPQAFDVAERMTRRMIPVRSPILTTLRDPESGIALDKALILGFTGPASFTGEDVIELHVHGSRAVIAAVLEVLGRDPGLRLAEPGEFARRAFENGKLDLTAIEALAALIDAETELQRRQALAHLEGHMRLTLEGWRERLLDALALVEAGLDFSDEADVGASAWLGDARAIAAGLVDAMAANLADGRRGELVGDGLRIVIAGPVNAGKSSLLNALAARDVAIVSPEPGTTRDIVEVRLDLAGMAVRVSDTAGLRDGAGAIEIEGIRRARKAMADAEIVVFLQPADSQHAASWADATHTGPRHGQAHVLRVISKSDIGRPAARPPGDYDLAISTVTGAGITDLVARLTELCRERLAAGDAAPALIANARHRRELEAAVASLRDFEAEASRQPGEVRPELAAEELRSAVAAIDRLVGKSDVERVLDRIFAGFCIGK